MFHYVCDRPKRSIAPAVDVDAANIESRGNFEKQKPIVQNWPNVLCGPIFGEESQFFTPSDSVRCSSILIGRD